MMSGGFYDEGKRLVHAGSDPLRPAVGDGHRPSITAGSKYSWRYFLPLPLAWRLSPSPGAAARVAYLGQAEAQGEREPKKEVKKSFPDDVIPME